MADTLLDEQPTLWDEPAPLEPGVVPVCSICGARGPMIRPDGGSVADFYAATQFALVEIWRHEREMHPKPADSSESP